LLGFGSPFTQLLSTSSGTLTYICISSPPTPSYVCRCICGYVALRRSNLSPKGLPRRARFITSDARSLKKRGTIPLKKTASLAV
jgi:hypothetical protein